MRIALYEPPDPRSDPYPFGTSRVTELMTLALEWAGHQVDRVTAGADEEIVADSQAKPDVWISSRIDHGSGDRPGRAACAALGIPHILLQPEIGGVQDSAATPEPATILQAIAAANATFVLSGAHAWAISEHLPSHADRVVVLPPFIDFDAAHRAKGDCQRRRARLAVELNLPKDVPWLIAAGPMATDRDLESYQFLAQCLSPLAAPKWHLIVAGAGPRQAEVGALLARIPAQRCRVLTIGTPDELLSILACGDLFVSPSIDERLSLTALDAQAVGLPVVAGASAAMRDVVVNGRTGTLTKPGDAASLSNAAGFLLRHPDFRRTYAQQGPEWVGRNFDVRAVASQLDAALQRVVRLVDPGHAAPPVRPLH